MFSLALLIPTLTLAHLPNEPKLYTKGSGFSLNCKSLLKTEIPSPAAARAEAKSGLGPHFYVSSDLTGKRPISEINTLRVASYNVQDLMEVGTLIKGKTQCDGIQKTILEIDPDILIGVEIQSLDVLSAATQDKIFERYLVILIPGNDKKRNIAILVKRDLPFDLEVQSHKSYRHEYMGQQEHF